jgi:gliding motility-associated-like protein
LCNGGSTGSIAITQPSLGTAPFEYSINGSPWQSSNLFTGLAANTYTISYRSANGCLGSQQVIITEPAVLAAATPMVPVICNGETNGRITINPSGGTAPYMYSINGGTSWQSNNSFMVPAGQYIITIRDANNCMITRTVDVTEPAILTATSNNTNATCDGGNDGRIVVIANGGNNGYRYSIDGAPFQASNIFNVAPGTYFIAVRDALGCDTSFTTTVGLTFNLFLNNLNDVSICDGTSTQLQLNTNANIFTWTPSAGLSDTTIRNPIANPSATTKYFVTVVLGRCDLKDSLTVIVNPAPIPDAGPDGDICYGKSYTLLGSGGAQYNWTPAIYLNTTSGANPIATPTITTTYTLSVIDAIGCHSLVTDQVTVEVSQPMRINMYPFDTVGYPGQQIQLYATSAGISYSWSPAIRLNNPSIQNPVATVGNIGDDIMYRVTGTTADGCKGEGYVTIRVAKGPDIYVPTGFTPNRDGKNDKFTPRPVGIKSFRSFKVFNRWGQVIFSTTRMGDGWDGTIAGKEQPSGVYVWAIEAIDYNNRVISKKGTITLIR